MTIRLRHLAEVNPATPEFDWLPPDSLVPFLPLEAVWPGGMLDVSRRRPRSEVAVGYTRFREGDILIPKITPTFQADRTVIACGIEGGIGAGTTELHIVRVSNCADSHYVRYLLSSKPALDEGEASMIGVAGQKRVPDNFFRDLRVPVADLSQQRAIADYLDAETGRIDALIAKRRRMIELLDEREQAIRDIWVNDQFSRWDSAAFRRQLSHIEQGWSPQCEAVPAEQGEWGVLKTSAVSKGVFLPDENKRLPEYVEPDERWRVRDGDLLVTRGSGSADMVGRAAVACTEGRKLLLSDLIYRLVPYSSDTEYLAEILQSRRLRGLIRACIRMDSGQTLKVRVNDLRELPVPLTPSTEQTRALVELHLRLARTLRVREMLHYQLQLLAEHRRALITAAVNGEIEIPGLAA